MKLIVSLSALNLSTYRKWMGSTKWDRSAYSDLFKKFEGDRNSFRIYLPLSLTPKAHKVITAPKDIRAYIENKGYVVDDYLAGIAVDKQTGKRKIKIGKLLSDNPALKKQFDHDELRKGSTLRDAQLMVVISRHPYDIMGMSTNRGWKSCLNVIDGSNKDYVKADIRHGTLIAYLIKTDDKNINNPIARCRIYRFTNKLDPKDYLLVREPRVFGTETKGFAQTVDKWLEQANEGRGSGLYCVHNDVYTDDVEAEFIKFSDYASLEKLLRAKKGRSEDISSERLAASIQSSTDIKPADYPRIVELLHELGWSSLYIFKIFGLPKFRDPQARKVFELMSTWPADSATTQILLNAARLIGGNLKHDTALQLLRLLASKVTVYEDRGAQMRRAIESMVRLLTGRLDDPAFVDALAHARSRFVKQFWALAPGTDLSKVKLSREGALQFTLALLQVRDLSDKEVAYVVRNFGGYRVYIHVLEHRPMTEEVFAAILAALKDNGNIWLAALSLAKNPTSTPDQWSRTLIAALEADEVPEQSYLSGLFTELVKRGQQDFILKFLRDNIARYPSMLEGFTDTSFAEEYPEIAKSIVDIIFDSNAWTHWQGYYLKDFLKSPYVSSERVMSMLKILGTDERARKIMTHSKVPFSYVIGLIDLDASKTKGSTIKRGIGTTATAADLCDVLIDKLHDLAGPKFAKAEKEVAAFVAPNLAKFAALSKKFSLTDHDPFGGLVTLLVTDVTLFSVKDFFSVKDLKFVYDNFGWRVQRELLKLKKLPRSLLKEVLAGSNERAVELLIDRIPNLWTTPDLAKLLVGSKYAQTRSYAATRVPLRGPYYDVLLHDPEYLVRVYVMRRMTPSQLEKAFEKETDEAVKKDLAREMDKRTRRGLDLEAEDGEDWPEIDDNLPEEGEEGEGEGEDEGEDEGEGEE